MSRIAPARSRIACWPFVRSRGCTCREPSGGSRLVEPQISRRRHFVPDSGTPTASVVGSSTSSTDDGRSPHFLHFRRPTTSLRGRFPAVRRGEVAKRQRSSGAALASDAEPKMGELGQTGRPCGSWNGGLTAGSGGAFWTISRSLAASARSRSVSTRARGGGSPGRSGIGGPRLTGFPSRRGFRVPRRLRLRVNPIRHAEHQSHARQYR